MKYVIIINGVGGSGKDTFIDLCSQYIPVARVSSIDPAKEAAHKLVGIDAKEESIKDEKLRSLLCKMKHLSIEYNDYPFKYVTDYIKNFISDKRKILFVHVREKEEVLKLQQYSIDYTDKYIFKTLLIQNDNVDKITTNASDNNVNNLCYDDIIYNNSSIKDLSDKAKKYLIKLNLIKKFQPKKYPYFSWEKINNKIPIRTQ